MTKILLINLPAVAEAYLNTNVKVGTPRYPNLSLATIAANIDSTHRLKVIDLDFSSNYIKAIDEVMNWFRPDFVCISISTVSVDSALTLAKHLKYKYKQMQIICGGVHVSTFPLEMFNTGLFDFVVLGEGDYALRDIVDKNINGSQHFILSLSDRESRVKTVIDDFKKRPNAVVDMDSLNLPKWEIFDIQRYKNSRLSSRKNPVGLMETSRGCPFQCNFCNKRIFGHYYRAKSPPRVVEEFLYLKKIGFREIHIIDDAFTQDLNRAKKICELLIQNGSPIIWSMFNGLRVDRVDFEFFKLAKKAGAWQVAFGIESGNQDVLNRINKKITLEQIRKAITWARRAGLDTFGFFIFGLSGENESSMCDTIEFAKSLPLNMAKFDICIPYPGTVFYEELERESRILTRDWSKYLCHQIDVPLYTHPNLSWGKLVYYYRNAFRSYYLRLSYIWNRFIRDCRMGDLLYDFKYLLMARF